jgi:predicted nuclease of predicted toxin-antitoxin system
MKLLFDENLSRKLVDLVRDLFSDSAHVSQLGLVGGTTDLAIWNFAKQNGFAIITADNDFSNLAGALGPPPKVILLENCDYPTNVALSLIRSNAIRISEFERNDRALLILRKP